ncbi:MAG TPA: sialidase family protein [Rhizomicrobium sp.]|nr:sialidase family protein [Rhizomicrobium sp.]
MATVLLLTVFAVSAGAQSVPTPPPSVPQFGLPTPTVFTSKIGFFTPDRIEGASYPRVIQLKVGPQKGTLLATFARRGPLMIFRSTDNGDSWQQFSEVPMLAGQPCLYELPVKMGEFPAGTIMACGGGMPAKAPGQRSLDVAVSRDGGKTWAYLSTIVTGGTGRYDPMDRAGLSRDQAPVFEPYLFADSQNRLVAYFSDERDKKSGYSQLLDHEVSTDGGKSWSAPVYDVAIPDGLSRPGMAIVARDGRGKFYMSYELVSAPGYALEPRTNSGHFRTSADGVNWGDAKSPGILVQDRWRQFPNGTPYIVWSPWGGPDGTLLMTGRSVVRDEIGRVGQGMFVNQHGGKGLWSLVETPIDYNIDVDGYSQTMLPLDDGQEILQLVTVNSRVEYAKFKLPEKLPTYGFPWDEGPATGPR